MQNKSNSPLINGQRLSGNFFVFFLGAISCVQFLFAFFLLAIFVPLSSREAALSNPTRRYGERCSWGASGVWGGASVENALLRAFSLQKRFVNPFAPGGTKQSRFIVVAVRKPQITFSLWDSLVSTGYLFFLHIDSVSASCFGFHGFCISVISFVFVDFFTFFMLSSSAEIRYLGKYHVFIFH